MFTKNPLYPKMLLIYVQKLVYHAKIYKVQTFSEYRSIDTIAFTDSFSWLGRWKVKYYEMVGKSKKTPTNPKTNLSTESWTVLYIAKASDYSFGQTFAQASV